MQVSIERSTLQTLLGHAQNVVERRTTIPILSNLRLLADGSRLEITATDMELTIHEGADAQVQAEGATTVPAHTLHDIVRKLPGEAKIELRQEPNSSEITVTSGRAVFTLPTLPAADFPAMGGESFEHRFSLSAADLKALIDKTRFAISNEEARYYLNGIHFHVRKSGATSALRAVATDGHRLARMEVGMPEGAADIPPVIVHKKTVAEMRRLLDDADEEVEISLSSNRIQMKAGSAVLVSRLVDGTFPDYERVIPANNDKQLVIDAKAFTSTVDRVATIATEKTRAIKLGIAPGKLTVSAISTTAGRGIEELDAGYQSDAMEIGFNSRYILEMMQQVEGDNVEMDLASPAAPTLVRDPGDDRAIFVLMPMRV
ncbi:MAG: DNA polymerase III subunit beta [Geminicoccaceae bacterium]